MRRLQKWGNSAIYGQDVRGGVGSAARKVAEKLDAPVREVCIQITGPMRSIAAPQPSLKEGRFRHDRDPPYGELQPCDPDRRCRPLRRTIFRDRFQNLVCVRRQLGLAGHL